MLIIDNLFQNEVFKVFLLSMLPITELRFSIPYGILQMNIHWVYVVLVSMIGNVFIGLVIIYLLGPIMNYLISFKIFNNIISFIFDRTKSKAEIVNKMKFYGLILFIGIPMPFTGVWTGTLASYLFRLSKSESIIAIIAGVILSSIIVTTLTLIGLNTLT